MAMTRGNAAAGQESFRDFLRLPIDDHPVSSLEHDFPCVKPGRKAHRGGNDLRPI
jgi:hypothetical protein